MKQVKWFTRFAVLMMAVLMIAGCCGTTKKVLKNTFWPDFVSIPAPQPGLVLPINSSPGVWAECLLFEGSYSIEELIVPAIAKGKLNFITAPLKHFTIDPPMSRPYTNGVASTAITIPLLLATFPKDYTLLVFHQNFRNWVVEVETINFSTTGNFLNDYWESNGRKIYADQVIELAHVRPYENRSFKFHRTYYPGHALLEMLGF